MAINKLKIMLSFMRELNDGNLPNADDYEISNEEFWNIIEACQDEKLIKGANFVKGGQGNRTLGAILESVRLTVKGLEYLNTNSLR